MDHVGCKSSQGPCPTCRVEMAVELAKTLAIAPTTELAVESDLESVKC